MNLPQREADDTRQLLLLYVQKQEHAVRLLSTLHAGLQRADRLRSDIYRAAKADAHVGEMSDGEDWIDVDRWGMSRSELRKGRDEDSGAATAENGAVAATAEGDVDAQGAVVMGGRKGKRRRNAAKD